MARRWLQRDFGIYVVNMFDTGQAARVLQLPGLGLKYLLQHFCGVRVRGERLYCFGFDTPTFCRSCPPCGGTPI